jgi:bifunctional enzyme CysN/CysC
VLDGDNVRHGLNKDLGFTAADRVENVRRLAEVARVLGDAGLIVIVAAISPFRQERELARDIAGEIDFLEVFVDTPLEVCERRDAKGLYAKARAGVLTNFTGVSSPYEAPVQPELRLRSGEAEPDALAEEIFAELRRRELV